MTRSNNSVSGQSDDEVEAGGFIANDPDVKTTKRRTSRRSSRNVSYKEPSAGEEEDDEDEEEDNKPLNQRKRTKVAKNGNSRRRTSAIKATKNLKKLDDDYDEYNDERDGDFKADNIEEDDDDDDDVILFKSNGTIQSNGHIVEISDESDLSNLEETPIAETSKKRKRAPAAKRKAKPKKVKIPYFTRITNKLYDNHPDLKDVFPDLAASSERSRVPERAEQPKGLAVKLLPFQLEGLHWLIKQEESKWGGGVLADEMGMGKTIQTISLLMNDTSKRPTLVVAPTVALMQWRSEIELHTRGALTVGIFHGASRTKNINELMENDVILTTYSVLESVYRKQMYGFRRKNGMVKEPSPLHSIPFYRVVLDEAHNIKDRNSGTSKAAHMLNTQKRWCLSGTPLQNRIGEMYSLIRYMNLFPFCEYFCTKCTCRSTEWKFTDRSHCDKCGHPPMLHTNFFNHFMLKNIQKHGIADAGLQSFEYIQLLLGNIMLRRTKVERADDLGLPPRIVEIKRCYFNEEEKDLYTSLYSDSRRQFNDYVAEGVVLNNYANIFTLITRMRQLADHPDLVLRRHLKGAQNSIVCQLCDDEAEEPIESKCHHKFCRMCITEYVESFDDDDSSKPLECPVCHIGLSIDLSQPALEVDEEVVKKGSIVNRIRMDGEWRSSTKIEALVESLYKLRSDKQTIKSIVFSQFTSMLDLIEWRLKRAGFETVKLQGSMSPLQRESTIKHFMENPQVEIFLVSLKAGGVALNLCEASQVFIMDPWWNPSVEWQSGDRVHRIGQHRPVKITRFCIEDSIEARIIELQDKKANMINATINHDEAAVNKLTPDDLQFLFMN